MGEESYSFKRAPLASEETWALDGSRLLRGGELQVDLRDVSRARFADMEVRRVQSVWLDLHGPAGRTRISCNRQFDDPQMQVFLRLVAAVMDALDKVRPDCPVVVGVGPSGRWAMFAIAAAAVLFGVFMLVAGLTGNVNHDRELGSIIIGLVFIGLFGLMGFSWLPFRSQPALTPREIAPIALALAAGNLPPEDSEGASEAPE